MTKALNTGLTIAFSTNVDSHLSMEVDSRPSGFNGGKTSFFAGDSPVVLLHSSSNVTLRELRATQGHISAIASGTYPVTEWVSCAMETTIKVRLPIASGFTIVSSYGDPFTGYVVEGDTIRFGSKKLISAEVSYSVAYTAYQITGDLGAAPVIVYALGEVAW